MLLRHAGHPFDTAPDQSNSVKIDGKDFAQSVDAMRTLGTQLGYLDMQDED
jgi:hypothetical protein